MSEIRAFVGHSFTDDDESVVMAFLKYLDALQQSPIGFSWVHAEPAQPTDLATKVMRLMEDRNLFIAICTKKQRVIDTRNLVPALLRSKWLQAPEEKFLWKTSDWIIQEIGLALGKGLSLILLLERGVEKPGGLQGNIEYIEFERAAPSACFDKILEMISALSPKAEAAVAVATDPRTSPEEQQVTSQPETTEEWWRPKPGWTQVRYDFVLEHMLATGKDEKVSVVVEAYLRSDLGQDENNKQRWNALLEVLKLVHGRNGSLVKLRELAIGHPDNAGVHEQLARGLVEFGEHREAALEYQAAASKAKMPQDKVRLLGRVAWSYTEAKQNPEAANAIMQMRIEVLRHPETELTLLRALVEIAKDKDASEAIPLLERILELRPDDDDTRFSLGYQHSQNSSEALALFHYSRIPERQRGGAAWNNLGATSDALELPGQAVAAYRRAADASETLAMSNLAQKLLNAGFVAEAKEECEKAMRLPAPHKNVGSTWSRVQGLAEAELKRRDQIVSDAKPTSDFYRLFGFALARPEPDTLAENWEAPEGSLAVTVDDKNFVATGSYERAGLGGLFGLGQVLGIGSAPANEKYRITYRGIIDGRTVKGTVYRTREGELPKPPTLLGGDDGVKFLIVVDGEQNEMKVMETPKPGDVRFYSLRKQK